MQNAQKQEVNFLPEYIFYITLSVTTFFGGKIVENKSKIIIII